ncbi:MAG: hypothetical protein ABI988_09705 [Nitrospirota bacterium]
MLSLVAIVMAFMALQRMGGMKNVRQQIGLMTVKTEGATKRTRGSAADALLRLEHMIRGQDDLPHATDGKSSSPSEPVSQS